MTIYFTKPFLLLLLLVLLPIVVYTARSLIGITRFRKALIIIFRSILFILLVCALSGLKIAQKSDELSVFFLLDVSKSISPQRIRNALTWIDETATAMQQNDRAGLIVFGTESSIERNLTEKMSVNEIQSHVDTNRTDIASALRLCLAAFPERTQKKIVLISDGNENSGDAVDAAYMARSNKAPIYIKPVEISAKTDIVLDKLDAPHSAAKGAPFDLKVFISAQHDTKTKLRLYKDDTLILEEMVPIEADRKNLYSARVNVPESGFHSFRAMIESPDDTIADNNIAYAFTYVKDIPRILYIEANPLDQCILPPILSQEKITIDLIQPQDLPDTIHPILSYDAIVLSNVSVDMLTFKQMEMLEKAVHEFGVGLIAIGGDQAYGPGGYQDTPLEKALPVTMDVRQKKVMPNGALVVILHTCEIPQGNTYAREIAIAALNVLSSKDYYGVLFYGGMGGEQWLFKPTLCSAKTTMIKMIKEVVPQDMPSFDLTLEMAYQELTQLETHVKHIVIISDGDPAQPNLNLSNKITDAKITISTVVINPHTPRDADVMQALAKLGKGNFYFPKPENYDALPKIFIKEAMVIRKSAIFEKPFVPVYATFSEVLSGFTQDDFPQLLGYVSTTPRETASVPLLAMNEDPLLCTWRYGVGKSVAFMSDATTRWAQHWIRWEKFDKFWGQIMRWAIRETAGGNYIVSTSTDGDSTRIVLDAMDNNGYFINYLQPRAHIITPDMETQNITLTQISPGKYAADITTAKQGNYMMSINVDDGDTPRIIMSGLSVSYSPEYNDKTTNELNLSKIAAISGGERITPDTNIFEHDPPTVWQPRDVWQYLISIAIILLLFDIFARRVIFGWEEIRALFTALGVQAARLRFLFQKRQRVTARMQTTTTLLKKREEVLKERKLKEQTSSEILKKLKTVKPETIEVSSSDMSAPESGKKEKAPGISEDKAPGKKPESGETYIKKLLDAKKKQKKD